MTFRKFVIEQVARLTAFESFARLPEDGKREFVNVLTDKAGEPRGRDRSALDWLDEIPAQRVRAVVNECLEFEAMPTLADMRAVWLRLFPPLSKLSKDCPDCAGTGWKIVERNGIEGAARCECAKMLTAV